MVSIRFGICCAATLAGHIPSGLASLRWRAAKLTLPTRPARTLTLGTPAALDAGRARHIAVALIHPEPERGGRGKKGYSRRRVFRPASIQRAHRARLAAASPAYGPTASLPV